MKETYLLCKLRSRISNTHSRFATSKVNFSGQGVNASRAAIFSADSQVFQDPCAWMTLAHFNLLESPFHERSEIHPQESLYKPISVKLTLWDSLYLPHYRKYKYVQVALFDIRSCPQQQCEPFRRYLEI